MCICMCYVCMCVLMYACLCDVCSHGCVSMHGVGVWRGGRYGSPFRTLSILEMSNLVS